MCTPKAPKPPDPVITANAQRDANIATAQNQTELNRYNEVTPFGTQSWARDPNNPNSYTLTSSFSPEVKAGIDSSISNNNRINEGVGQLITHVGNKLNKPSAEATTIDQARGYVRDADNTLYDPSAMVKRTMDSAARATNLVDQQIDRLGRLYGEDFNYDSAPGMPTADEATRQAVADALYNKSTSRLDPIFQQRDNDLATQLAAQGITQGSAAYDREMANLGREKTDAYEQAINSSNIGSIEAMQRLFDMGMDARQQGVNEANTIRTMPTTEALAASQIAGNANNMALGQAGNQINREMAVPAIANAMLGVDEKAFNMMNNERDQAIEELNSVRSGSQPLVPSFSQGSGGAGTVGQTPIADATYNSYQGALNNYNADMGSYNNILSGIAGLGGTALMAGMMGSGGAAAGGAGALAGLAAL